MLPVDQDTPIPAAIIGARWTSDGALGGQAWEKNGKKVQPLCGS
jgi:hypothetical protein